MMGSEHISQKIYLPQESFLTDNVTFFCLINCEEPNEYSLKYSNLNFFLLINEK